MLNKSIDPDSLHKDDLETVQSPPPNFLTPKSPVLEKEDDEPITDRSTPTTPRTPRTPRGMTSSKSDGNVVGLSKQRMPSNRGSMYNERTDHLGQSFVSTPHIGHDSHDGAPRKTSTPKYPPPPYNSRPYGDRPRVGSSGSDGSHSQPSPTIKDNGPGGHYSQGHYNHARNGPDGRPSPSSYANQNSSYTNSSYSSHPDHRSQSLHNQSNHGPPPSYQHHPRSGQYPNTNGMSRQSSDSSMNSNDPIYSTIPRKISNSSMPSRSPYSNSENLNSSQRHNGNNNYISNYSQKDNLQKAPSIDQLSEAALRPGRKYPAPLAPTEHFQDSRNTRNGDSGMSSQYTPGNVRSLVQNYQKSVQQNPRPQTPSPSQVPPTNPGMGREPPVPPPRRHRPLSAGPSRPTLGGAGTAFSSPRAQSVTPDYVPSDMRNNSSRSRTLPSRPDDHNKQQVARPGSTPPKPTQLDEDGKPKPNSVWYEYGCV